jgi:hypothetical protein
VADCPPARQRIRIGFIDVLVPDVQITTAAQLNAELATRVARGDFAAPAGDASMAVTDATVRPRRVVS